MYYVVYVGAGKENSAEMFIKKVISRRYCTSCFHPVRHMRKKIRGEWTDCWDRLVPGYVFITSEDIAGFYRELRKSPRLLKVLGKEEEDTEVKFYALTEEEAVWLEKLAGTWKPETSAGRNPMVGLSQVGFGENDEVVIVSGPLKDMTGLVKKINLHRRTAEVEIELMKRKLSLYLGIEILGKQLRDI